MTIGEKLTTAWRVFRIFGFQGVVKVFQNEKFFFQTIMNGDLGYALFKGIKQP